MPTRRRRNSYKVEGWISLGFKNSLVYRERVIVEDNNERKSKERFIKQFEGKIETLHENVSNFGLLANKFIPIIDTKMVDSRGREKEWFSLLKLDKECIGGEFKYPFLKTISYFSFKRDKYKRLTCRIKSQIDSLKRNGYIEILNQHFATKSRLIVGLGTDSVLETSLTLHKIFGIPYIPATALKGVVRAVKFWELAKAKNVVSNESTLKVFQEKFYGELDTSDEDTFKAQLLFGAKNFKGLLLFLDAFPEINNKKLFDVDIMNVHYPDYYTKNEPPTEWQQPTPIFFLTVKEGVKFYIAVLFDQYRYEKLPKEYKKLDLNNLRDELKKLLTPALSEFGIGAKTTLGYGILNK